MKEENAARRERDEVGEPCFVLLLRQFRRFPRSLFPAAERFPFLLLLRIGNEGVLRLL